MEIKLDNNGLLQADWIKPGLLRLQIFSPGADRSGHGYLLRHAGLLEGEELQQFLDSLTPEQKEAA